MKFKKLKVIRLEFSAATLEDSAEEAVRVKDLTGFPVEFWHRHVEVKVDLEDTPASVVDGYREFEEANEGRLAVLRGGY